jgi:hypothetical protein
MAALPQDGAFSVIHRPLQMIQAANIELTQGNFWTGQALRNVIRRIGHGIAIGLSIQRDPVREGRASFGTALDISRCRIPSV